MTPSSGSRSDESTPNAGAYRVAFDWRGETAYYIEQSRRVALASFYWGGPNGTVSHIDGMWDYEDGRRESLTPDERRTVLDRVIDAAWKGEEITLKVEGE